MTEKDGTRCPILTRENFTVNLEVLMCSITVPKNYVVAATGELQNANEKEWLKSRASFSWKPD